jgi:hypothetical protein
MAAFEILYSCPKNRYLLNPSTVFEKQEWSEANSGLIQDASSVRN